MVVGETGGNKLVLDRYKVVQRDLGHGFTRAERRPRINTDWSALFRTATSPLIPLPTAPVWPIWRRRAATMSARWCNFGLALQKIGDMGLIGYICPVPAGRSDL